MTPIKRLGLSRKRKSLPEDLEAEESRNVVHQCSVNKINKVHNEITSLEEINSNQVSEKANNCLAGCDRKTKVIQNEHEMKIDNEFHPENKIKTLEKLCEIWKNGCKNALLYLVRLIEERQGQSPNVEKLLRELKILEVISTHFANDPDLDFLFCGNETN